MVKEIEDHNPVTGAHVRHGSQFFEILFNHAKQEKEHRGELFQYDHDLVVASAKLHDFGKTEIENDILDKTGKLTDEDLEILRTHASLGVERLKEIMAGLPESIIQPSLIMAGAHHEKWNGKGYPNGLKGAEIPLLGRMMAVADVYEALVANRPYKKVLSHDEACKIIENDIGEHFCPSVGQIFIECKNQFKALHKELDYDNIEHNKEKS